METKNYANYLRWSAVFLLIGIVAWAVLQTMSSIDGSMVEQASWIETHLSLYKLSFLVGSLLNIPSALALLIMVAQKRTEHRSGLMDSLGLIFLVLYIAFIQFAYCSQYLFIPRLITNLEPTRMAIFEALYIGNHDSIPALMKMMGYTFMSVSAVTIGFPFQTIKGYSRWISWFLFLSGVAGLIGWIEYYFELSTGGVGLALSGLFMIPFCVAVIMTTRNN